MAAQLDMWGEAEPVGDTAPEEASAPPPADAPAGPSPLMPHQERAVDAIQKGLSEYQGFLLVLPTGTGKTRCATEIARRRKRDNILFLAHRDELLQQALDRLGGDTGEMIGLDQAQWFGGNERIVVGSIQTISNPQRLARFRPDRFDLVVVDEGHHVCSVTYRRVLDHFVDAKYLLMTATPDRKDEKSLGEFCDDAFVYDIEDAVADGVLCNMRIFPYPIHGLDLSSVKTTSTGDLNQEQLEAVVASEEVLLGYADVILREAGARKTVVFTPGVESAKQLARIMCRHREGCARSVDGKTETELRRATLSDHQTGRYQFLINCGIVSEGYDDESIACIAQGRPTRSRSLSAQMIGRGLRKKRTGSFKDLLVIEFTSNAKPGFLSTPLDVLGGHHSDDEKELAQKFLEKEPGTSARAALDKASAQMEREKREQEEVARRAAIVAHAIYTKGSAINPFGVFHMNLEREIETSIRFGGKEISAKQIGFLKWKGVPIPPGCNSKLAQRLIGTVIVREKHGRASFKDLQALQTYGINQVNISAARAHEVLGAIKRNGGRPLPAQQLQTLLNRERQPGE